MLVVQRHADSVRLATLGVPRARARDAAVTLLGRCKTQHRLTITNCRSQFQNKTEFLFSLLKKSGAFLCLNWTGQVHSDRVAGQAVSVWRSLDQPHGWCRVLVLVGVSCSVSLVLYLSCLWVVCGSGGCAPANQDCRPKRHPPPDLRQ